MDVELDGGEAEPLGVAEAAQRVLRRFATGATVAGETD
jgi:hypothetical protein